MRSFSVSISSETCASFLLLVVVYLSHTKYIYNSVLPYCCSRGRWYKQPCAIALVRLLLLYSQCSINTIIGTSMPVCCFSVLVHPIYYLRSSTPSSCLPSRYSDPGSQSRLFTVPNCGACLAFFSREEFSIFFPGRLASNCAYRYTLLIQALSTVSFSFPETPSSMRIELQQKILEISRFTTRRPERPAVCVHHRSTLLTAVLYYCTLYLVLLYEYRLQLQQTTGGVMLRAY